MFRFCCTILLALTSFVTSAQEILTRPEAKFITSFPFKQYSGGVMVIRAGFADLKDSLNFILDTGSGGISLDSATCQELKLHPTSTDTTITGIGGIKKVPFLFNKTLHMPGLTLSHLNFHVTDYAVLTSVYGEKVDGIIGYSFFSQYIVKINFDNNIIDVFSPGEMKYPDEGTILRPAFTSLPIQFVNIKDRKKTGFNFYFDTGAGLCLLMSEKFAKDSSIILSRRRPVITQAEGMAGKFQMRLTVIKELKIGPYKFKRVPTYLYEDEFNVTAYPYTGGLLGIDLLRHFNLIVNYPAREIHLQPNSHFRESFDYAYTGLGIYQVDDRIIVEDVIKFSPGDKAGFKAGDEIVSVDKNFSHNIQAYKNILQTPSEDMKVVIRRDGVLYILLLRTQSIR